MPSPAERRAPVACVTVMPITLGTVIAVTVQLKETRLDFSPVASAAITDTTKNPGVVGAPAIELPLTESPGGMPDAIHVYGSVPPDADNATEVHAPRAVFWLAGEVTTGLPPNVLGRGTQPLQG